MRYFVITSQPIVCVCADLYGFEHALSVVIWPQVFWDVEAHRANGGDEMKNHRNNLNNKNTSDWTNLFLAASGMKNLTPLPYMTKTTARSWRVKLNTFSRTGVDIKQGLQAHRDGEEKQEPSSKAIQPQTSGAPAKSNQITFIVTWFDLI